MSKTNFCSKKTPLYPLGGLMWEEKMSNIQRKTV